MKAGTGGTREQGKGTPSLSSKRVEEESGCWRWRPSSITFHDSAAPECTLSLETIAGLLVLEPSSAGDQFNTVMATICQAVPASGLFSPSIIEHGRRHRGASQLISQAVGSRIFRTLPQRDFVTCCSSNDIRSHDTEKSSENHIGNLAWWEKVNTAAVGVILGVSIGTSCFALPALADFLSFDHADLRGRDMSGEDLKGVVFAACDCRKINLEGSNMDGSTDTFAGFEGGNLKNSSWVRAFADRVVFRGANLQNANFTDAVLSGSQFDGADITGADFTDALVDHYQRLQMCRRAKGTNPTTGVATRESLFC